MPRAGAGGCTLARVRRRRIRPLHVLHAVSAGSYFYGYTKLLAIRGDAEKALNGKLDLKSFHDFILAQGLLPPDLIRQAVMKNFVPAQQASLAH
jgi:hypothetical protein